METAEHRDRRSVEEISALLRTFRSGGPPVLDQVLPPLRSLLRGMQAVAYNVAFPEDRFILEAFHADGPHPVALQRREFEGILEGAPRRGWGAYNPIRPEASQRNRVFGAEDLQLGDRPLTPPLRQFFSRWGIDREQIRVVVCDGPALLAWVGVYRDDPATPRDRRVFQSLVPSLQARLRLERNLALSDLAWSAMEAALEAVAAPAFLVRGTSGIVHANEAGRALLDGDASRVREELRESIRSGLAADPYEVFPLAAAGVSGHVLALRRTPPEDPSHRVRAAARRWGLTPRQTEVLGLLVQGASNLTLSATLGCSEKTVERHLSDLFDKAQCRRRSELVAKVWSGPP